ncbi:MAG: hemin uptake protein HemP, partial [Pirellulaceae bacterium]
PEADPRPSSPTPAQSPQERALIRRDPSSEPGLDLPLDFQELAGGRSAVYISLDGVIYKLLRTKNHKLILTK